MFYIEGVWYLENIFSFMKTDIVEFELELPPQI